MTGTRHEQTLEAVSSRALLRHSWRKRGPVAHEHDLAGHASLPEQLMRVSGLGQRPALRDERPDLVLVQEVQQSEQILTKPGRSQPFEPLNAVGDHPFPA